MHHRDVNPCFSISNSWRKFTEPRYHIPPVGSHQVGLLNTKSRCILEWWHHSLNIWDANSQGYFLLLFITIKAVWAFFSLVLNPFKSDGVNLETSISPLWSEGCCRCSGGSGEERETNDLTNCVYDALQSFVIKTLIQPAIPPPPHSPLHLLYRLK